MCGDEMSRRLVLNGLTAEVGAAAPEVPPEKAPESDSPDSLEFYHELELYKQLLALPAPSRSPVRASRRARTPDPPQPRRRHDELPRRSRTPVAGSPVTNCPHVSEPSSPAASGRFLQEQTRSAKYLGSFPVDGGEHAARAHAVSTHLHLMKESGRAVPVLVVIALSGVKVCDPEDQSVRMSHALRRISYATCEGARALFAFVAREPRCEPTAPTAPTAPTPTASLHYCHAFHADTPEQAEELNSLVGDAFRMAFASQLHPSAPIWATVATYIKWTTGVYNTSNVTADASALPTTVGLRSKELSGECGGMGVRAPDSLPGLTHHYPHCLDSSPTKCDIMGVSTLMNEASPSSSEESNSPTEMNCYRRLGHADKPPLMKRLAMGLSGALLQPSDDDSTPLVADTPTTPTNGPLCLNGGYINEASEAEARTRESNRDHSAGDCGLGGHCGLGGPTRIDNDRLKSSLTSSSSGASSCGASRCSGNNNAPRHEPELRHAPWFQAGIPREIALEVLAGQAVGAFMVRCSTTQAGCHALSVRVPRDFTPSGIAHYLILRTPKGYKIKGFTKEFATLSALVTHHSVMPELLPCPLRLPPRVPPAPPSRAHMDDVRSHPAHPAHSAHRPNLLAQLDV